MITKRKVYKLRKHNQYMRNQIETTLENLITSNNSLGRQIITGFNFHPVCLQSYTSTIITFSNIQSSQDYLHKVIEDFKKGGFPEDEVSLSTRDKIGYYRWKPGFFIRDEKGLLEKNLNIRDIETGKYLNLGEISQSTLDEAGYTAEEIDNLIAENEGYEINIFISDTRHIPRLSREFLRKSSRRLYDENGDLVFESEEEIEERAPWPGAWDVPVLIIGGDLMLIKQAVPGFQEACLFRFQDASVGEYNFVINRQLATLQRSEEHGQLLKKGFLPETCLANIRFVRDYIDVL